MQPKTIKTIYWILVSILCLFMLLDGIGGITMQQQGIDALKHLGFPSYIMPLFGWLKILGIITLLQTKFARIKEWVFAGLVFNFIGAFVAHVCAKDPITHLIAPLVFIGFTFVVRMFWEKYNALKIKA